MAVEEALVDTKEAEDVQVDLAEVETLVAEEDLEVQKDQETLQEDSLEERKEEDINLHIAYLTNGN